MALESKVIATSRLMGAIDRRGVIKLPGNAPTCAKNEDESRCTVLAPIGLGGPC